MKAMAASTLKPVYLIEGPPSLMDSLSKIENIRLINIWISLQTKEQFIKQATEIVQTQVLEYKQQLTSNNNNNNNQKTNNNLIKLENEDELAQLCTQKMFELVNLAAQDVQFYMSRAPLFEFTLLNSESTDETAMEMLDILQSAFQ